MIAMQTRAKMKGVTMLELMVVVVIVAILATVAYPSYTSSIRKARRADGAAAVSGIQQAQAKLRASCRFYAQNLGAADVCGATAAATTIRAAATSPDGRYAIALSAASGTGYTITATGQADQANDKAQGTTCTLVMAVSAGNPNGAHTPAACW